MKNRTFTEAEFKQAVANSHSIRQTLICLGLNSKGGGAYRAFHNAVKDWNVDTSHFKGQGWNKGNEYAPKRELSEYLSNKHPINSHRLRLRLLKEGYFEAECSICNLHEWNGKPIPLELDHIDGDHLNNSLANLRIVCPNCHAQMPTHAGKNKGTYS
jgi:hypothetical protein